MVPGEDRRVTALLTLTLTLPLPLPLPLTLTLARTLALTLTRPSPGAERKMIGCYLSRDALDSRLRSTGLLEMCG